MWDSVRYYVEENKKFATRLNVKRSTFTVTKFDKKDFILSCSLLAKSRKMRIFGYSSLSELSAIPDSTLLLFNDFCSEFSLSTAQTRIIENSIVLTSRDFSALLAPISTNNVLAWNIFSISRFLLFFNSFFQTRGFLVKNCLLCNKQRFVSYFYQPLKIVAQFKNGNLNLRSFRQNTTVFYRALQNFCLVTVPLIFFFFTYLYLLVVVQQQCFRVLSSF